MLESQLELNRKDRAFAAAISNRRLELIILPTEKCNFRCTYCYESFKVGRMSKETVTGIKRLIEQRIGDLSLLSLMWFGGEPLMALDIVSDISSYVQSLAVDHIDLRYIGSMTTNGYRLSLSSLQKLVSLGIHEFQISLDGPQELHDQTRVTFNQKGTFEQIWTNLLAIKASSIDTDIILRLHITPGNRSYLGEFTARLSETFLSDPRFSLLFTPIAHLGGPNDGNFDVMSTGAANAIIQELKAIAYAHSGISAPQSSLIRSEPHVCYASKPNSLLIRANGRIGKCTVALEDASNDIGALLSDGSVVINNAKHQPWLRGWASGDWGELGCPLENFPLSKSVVSLQDIQ